MHRSAIPRRTRLARLVLSLALLAGVLWVPAKAAALPPGSYQGTCRDCYTEGTELRCECQDRDANWRQARIRYKRCEWAVMNDNGRLACEDARHAPPPGSWRDSCRSWRVRGDTLSAECKDRYGSWSRTRVNYKKCRGGVVNDDGRLVCEGDAGPAPGGTWQASCRNWRRVKDTLHAECRNRRGDWVRSSLNVRRCDAPQNCDGRLTCGKCR
ncbi:MAG: hypothetical protein C4525_10900 [Desulfarculus sp.]|nr:MAG: hypothetical protein C4525_10900 [Desulfarculus sp.]